MTLIKARLTISRHDKDMEADVATALMMMVESIISAAPAM